MTDAKKPEPLELDADPFHAADFYDWLGIAREADRAEIKAAYRAVQKRSRRGDEAWTRAQQANEALTKPKKRLVVDLFVLSKDRKYQELVRRYGDISFEPAPPQPGPLLLLATPPPDPVAEMTVPNLPPLAFERMLPEAPGDVVPIRRRKDTL